MSDLKALASGLLARPSTNRSFRILSILSLEIFFTHFPICDFCKYVEVVLLCPPKTEKNSRGGN